MKNVVIEMIRNEMGELIFNECSLGEWSWLNYVWGGDFELDKIDVDFWKEKIDTLVGEFENDEELEGDEWIDVKNKFYGTLEKIDWGNVSMCRIGGYSIEYDNCVCVILGIED